MRAKDFLSSIILSEGMMTYPNWSKHDAKKGFYYFQPFVEGILSGQVYAFQYNGENFNGIIQNPKALKRQMMKALNGEIEFKDIIFTVKVLDDEGEPTGEIVDGVHLNQIYKDEKIKGTLNPNMGNVSEIILGCAVTAKFEKMGQEITANDVLSMGLRLADSGGVVNSKAGKDVVTFTVKTVPFLDKKTFFVYVGKYPGKTLSDFNMPPAKVAELENAINSAVAYANHSKRVLAALQTAQQDPGKNIVDVISDGGEKENQNTTKVDLKILVDGKNAVKNLLSLKAGNVKQFGQVGGSNFVNLDEFFRTTVGVPLSEVVKKKFKEIPAGTRNTGDLKQRNFDVAFSAAYKEVNKAIKIMAATDQKTLVKNVYNGLMYHLTKNEAGVEMVILSPNAKKAFQELSFGPEFQKAINQLHLTVEINFTDKAYWMFIYGFPATEFSKKSIGTAKHKLVELWSVYNPKTGVMRNRVGMGNLLKDIADLENIIEHQPQQPVPKAKLPAVKSVPQARPPQQNTVPKVNNPPIEQNIEEPQV
jgi:hypothetical protein